MKVLKGQKLVVNHCRKGTFKAVALRDFDTETEEFFPVATLEYVRGANNDWVKGEEIPCRNCLCNIRPLEEGQ